MFRSIRSVNDRPQTPALPAESAEEREAGVHRDEKIEIAKAEAERLDLDEKDGATSSSSTSSAPAAARQQELVKKRVWWHRHFEPSERQRVMLELGIRKQDHWAFRFTTMLTLSVIVAVMGLSANSAAVVIGAMLLAPLMQPVLASAACISMGLFKKSLQAIGHVALATAWGILLSYVLAALFVRGELPTEVTSRTAPDIRDLVVALGAGTAGAYATVRKDVSSSLPGVAVAVALVPPLGTVGIALQGGYTTFAKGAMLLYTTNLVAIVLAGAIVFVATGFVPPRRLASTFPRTALAAAVVAVAVAAIAVPLYRASTSAVEQSERQIEAQAIVRDWLGLVDTRAEPTIDFDDANDRILVGIRSFEPALDAQSLTDDLHARFGDDVAVSVEWLKVDQATTTTTEMPTTTVVSGEEILLGRVETIVDAWLADEVPESGRRDALAIESGVVYLDASGVGNAPPVPTLTERLDAELNQTLEVRLTWLERTSVDVAAPPTPDEQVGTSIAVLSRAWADSRGLTVMSTTFDGETATIELAGAEPPDATDLVDEIEALLDPTDTVTILFTVRLDITTTTTTSTTTTTVESTTTTT